MLKGVFVKKASSNMKVQVASNGVNHPDYGPDYGPIDWATVSKVTVSRKKNVHVLLMMVFSHLRRF